MNAQALPPSIPAATALAPVTIDELSSVRYVHARSLKAAIAGWAAEDERAAYLAFVYAPAYGADIERAIAGRRLIGGYVDNALVATAGWSPVESDTTSARIRWCHVEPLFKGLGLGTKLLAATETAAAAAGHDTLVVRATPASVGFFQNAGYAVTAQGTRPIGPDQAVPVVFLKRNLQARPRIG